MRYVATSDLHIGKRQFPASEDGRNARECDIERAWARAVELMVREQPDLVTIAGDVFEHPRVGMYAVIAFRDGVRRIVDETDATVVVIQGNHDGGRTAEVLTPIAVARGEARVHVATSPKRLRFRAASTGESVAVACLPFTVLDEERTYRLQPDPDADVNVMVIHAPVNTTAEGVERLPAFYAGEESLDVGRLAEEFDVVAAGDFHDFRRLHPTRAAFYSGSLELVSSDIWHESRRKGVVCGDTLAGELEFRGIPGRRVEDFQFQDSAWLDDPVEPIALNAAGVNDYLCGLLADDALAGAIVRLKVDSFPRSEKDSIDWSLVRQLKQTCLHFELSIQYTRTESAAGDRRDRRGRSLIDEAREFFADDDEPVRDLVLAHLVDEEGAHA